MRAPVLAKLSTSNTPARMLRGTVTTLGCAFLLVLAAATTVVISIKREANLIEAVRQRERIEAALDSQAHLRRLRLDSMGGTGELQRAMAEPDPLPALHAAFARLAGRFLEYDGAYIVTASGLVLTGIENGVTAGQAGYNGLKHFSARIPGGAAARSVPAGSNLVAPIFIHDGHEAIALLVADISTASTPLLASTIGPLKLVGYRRVTDAVLTEISTRYRVADMRLTRSAPSDVNSRLEIPAPDGSIKAWLTWTPDRPGDMVLRQFIWALAAVGLLFAGIFGLVVYRLRVAAYEVVLRERQIQRLAGQDELSLLPNRRTFDLRLDQELAQRARTGASLAVLMLDLDRFKAVNDTYGHTAGDELIRQVAERLVGLVRQGDTVARLGGDEFGIIQTNLTGPDGCVPMCERILQALGKPFTIHGVETTIGCSIGIALATGKDMDRATLLKLADTALYRSKNEGRNRFSFFEPHMNRSLQVKRMVEEDLRNAIVNDELQIHYQPQVSIDGLTVIGVEALVRWPHPVHGMVPPSDFIGIAEERGLIVPLSEWVLRRACLEAKRWEGIRLSVNVSPIQFRHADFVGNVLRIIEETGFDPTRLELELTEGVVVEDADAAEAAMMDLRSHGIGLALDDFGTGYSSLIYLRRFAFDKIKIDRSFLEYMETTGESAILVHSIAHLGRALGLRVCAEGVETVEQHRFLQAIGCHEMQGFLFSKAVPAEQVDRLLAQEQPFAAVLAAA
jgi:diguanylate cyclase (GGDEF)-like protein